MSTWADFQGWLKENPKVYPAFEKYALRAAQHGKVVGGKLIVERLRWDLTFETRGDGVFKINNNWTAFLVRKFKEQYPGYGKIFSVRKSQADKEGAPTTFPTKGGQGYITGW